MQEHRGRLSKGAQNMRTSSNNPELNEDVDMLGKAIHWLQQQTLCLQKPMEPSALCHMDCQPQNLIFATTTTQTKLTHNSEPNIISHTTLLPQVSSVMD